MGTIADYQQTLKRAGLYLGEIDGDFGPLTLSAAAQFHAVKTKLTPPWMLVAANELGVSEILGPRSNQRIVQYHGSTDMGEAPDEVPWCSSFVNWCMAKAGLHGTRSAAARSWDTWGNSTGMRFGAVVTFPRTGGSGRHVALVAGFTDTMVFHLGGNQGDAVNVHASPRHQIAQLRWPAG